MVELVTVIVLIILGYSFGSVAESRHYRSILKREKETLDVEMVNLSRSMNIEDVSDAGLVSGSVVVSSDYFKSAMASLRMIFGGRMKSFETLLDRGRREAILRMKQEAIDQGMSKVFNVRIETSTIGLAGGGQSRGIGSIEVLAYGTGIRNSA